MADSIIDPLTNELLKEVDDNVSQVQNETLSAVNTINQRFSDKGYDIKGVVYQRYADDDSLRYTNNYYLDTSGMLHKLEMILDDQNQVVTDTLDYTSRNLEDGLNDIKEEISFQSNIIENNQINSAQMLDSHFRSLNQAIDDNTANSKTIADAIEDSSKKSSSALKEIGSIIKQASLDTGEFFHDIIGELIENSDNYWNTLVREVDNFIDEYGDVFGFWFNELLELLKLLFSFNEEGLEDVINAIYEKLRDFSLNFRC